jgi:hypothetical protein
LAKPFSYFSTIKPGALDVCLSGFDCRTFVHDVPKGSLSINPTYTLGARDGFSFSAAHNCFPKKVGTVCPLNARRLGDREQKQSKRATDPALLPLSSVRSGNWQLNTSHLRGNLERMTPEERSDKQRELAEKESHLTNVRENYGILNRGISGVGDDDSDSAWKSEEATMEKEIAELKKQLAQDE